MTSELAIQKAAQCWCMPETEHIEMNSNLAYAFANVLDKYIEALRWTGGSFDFTPEGKAFEGWNQVVKGLLE